MSHMYFSGEDSNDITFDEPTLNCIEVNPTLFANVQSDREQNVWVFLDTHLLKIRSTGDLVEHAPEKFVSKNHASISVGMAPDLSVLAYITDAMINAEFREVSSVEFKSTYLAPLEASMRELKFSMWPLQRSYSYSLGNPGHVEFHIQEYCNILANSKPLP